MVGMYFKKEDSKFNYFVGAVPEDKKKISGPLENIPVDKKNGHEILYIINAMLDKYDLNKEAGRIIERNLRFYVPKPYITQIKIAEWIYENKIKHIEDKLRR